MGSCDIFHAQKLMQKTGKNVPAKEKAVESQTTR